MKSVLLRFGALTKSAVDFFWSCFKSTVDTAFFTLMFLLTMGLTAAEDTLDKVKRNSGTKLKAGEFYKREHAWLEQEPEAIFLTYRTGFRTWSIQKQSDRFVLTSAGNTIWEPREKLTAVCQACPASEHEAPYPMCSCGIHAMNSMEDIKDPTKDALRLSFAGEVKLWGGNVLEYSDGVRAQFAYPLNITDARCGLCEKYVKLEKARYHHPRGVCSDVFALCREHDKNVGSEHFEVLEPSFLSQIAEDYGIKVG